MSDPARMSRGELIDYCLAKPGATADFPFDDHTMTIRVGKRIFALLDVKSQSEAVNLKCDPALSRDLRASYPEIVPGFHMNKEHWNTLSLDGRLPRALVEGLVDRSYELVLGPRRSVRPSAPGRGKSPSS